jgi:para-nitrobenzyl esterase
VPDRMTIRRAGLAAAAVAAILAATAACARSRQVAGTQPTARVSQGVLRGRLDHGVQEFLDIPYAAPPVGRRRFAPPAPPARWGGVRPATRHGPACIQWESDPPSVPRGTPTSEDCLHLDVYAPGDARPGRRLPVLFFIHGGGNVQGSGILFDGERFARLTNALMVSINYRLGPDGWLALPELRGPAGVGNDGLLDQLRALRWVRRNIAAFGGDPHRITIDGQSAGSESVCDLLSSPLARGLFARAILESGPCTYRTPYPPAAAEALGRLFAGAVGCTRPAEMARCLRAVPTVRLLAAAQIDPVANEVTGTRLLPLSPERAIRMGRWNRMPLIIGSTRDEAKLFEIDRPDLTAGEYVAAVRAGWGRHGDAVLARYPLSRYPRPFYALAAIDTDSGTACYSYWMARETAAQVPTYEEEFDDPTSPTLRGFQPPGIDMANAHAAELAYLFGYSLAARPLTPAERALGDRMDRYWGQFAATGNPTVAGQTPWPRMSAGDPRVIELRTRRTVVSSSAFAAEHRCAFWATLEPTSN